MSKFKIDILNLNHVYFSKWLIYYYEAWTQIKSKSILYEYENFRKNQYPFDEKSINQFEENILSFWTGVLPITKELRYIA